MKHNQSLSKDNDMHTVKAKRVAVTQAAIIIFISLQLQYQKADLDHYRSPNSVTNQASIDPLRLCHFSLACTAILYTKIHWQHIYRQYQSKRVLHIITACTALL